METKIAIPSQNGTDSVVLDKKNGALSEETSEMDFIDSFLSVLITNMNPNDLSLDSTTSEKLSKLIKSDSIGNQEISSIDLKQFINSLKSELANGKPHKFSLESMKETVANLLSNQSTVKLNTTAIEQVTEQLNQSTGKLLKVENNTVDSVQTEASSKFEQQQKTISANAPIEDTGNDSTEKLLLNLRKFLTKDEFENIKNNLQTSIAKKNVEVSPKTEVINRFISLITGKELEAKSKIVSKANNINLETNQVPKTNVSILNLPNNVDLESELISKENGNLTSPKTSLIASEQVAATEVQPKSSKYFTSEKQAVNIENEIKAEQSIANGSSKNEGDLSKEFAKQHSKEQLKQRIVKSDVSELLTKTNTKKVELKKTENIVKSNFVEKAIKNIKMTKSGGSNIARIMLNPRSLGDITLRVTMIGNNVKLYIKADKSEAAEHIDRQLPLLKERMVESGLKVEQVVIESSETEHLANNQQRQNRNEKEELRRQFVKSFGKIAAKREFDISMNDVAYYNNNPFVGYTKAGSKVNV